MHDAMAWRRRPLLPALLLSGLALRAQAQAPLPGERAIGRADAPVTVVEFHSLTCGNCARFHNDVFPRIRAAFIEPGLVRFVLRDFPLDRAALDAAAMVHCAGPERFEPLVSLVYAQKENWAHSADPRAALRRYAALAGLPGERLEQCWADTAFLGAIMRMRLDAEREHGVNATPSFLIGGRVHRGVLEFDRFAALVRPLLPPAARP
ncbi:thioredoxin domain-containing protein [Roseococcus sp. DSY-14]|uniref:thioredoxin domain-containing protein n=1 Tax=Roseococcus sp. DSY-14 TaxID=3369650 RepID=UPI00387B8831